MASEQVNKRIFKSEISKDLSYIELKKALKNEQRQEKKVEIKEIISNKIFAKVVFAICLGLNALFLTLATLNYLGVLV